MGSQRVGHTERLHSLKGTGFPRFPPDLQLVTMSHQQHRIRSWLPPSLTAACPRGPSSHVTSSGKPFPLHIHSFLRVTGVEVKSFLNFYLSYFLAALGLPCCGQAFSSCGMWGLLTAVASFVAEHRF